MSKTCPSAAPNIRLDLINTLFSIFRRAPLVGFQGGKFAEATSQSGSSNESRANFLEHDQVDLFGEFIKVTREIRNQFSPKRSFTRNICRRAYPTADTPNTISEKTNQPTT